MIRHTAASMMAVAQSKRAALFSTFSMTILPRSCSAPKPSSLAVFVSLAKVTRPPGCRRRPKVQSWARATGASSLRISQGPGSPKRALPLSTVSPLPEMQECTTTQYGPSGSGGCMKQETLWRARARLRPARCAVLARPGVEEKTDLTSPSPGFAGPGQRPIGVPRSLQSESVVPVDSGLPQTTIV